MARPYPKLKGDDGKDFTIIIDKFGKGTITLFDDTRQPTDAVKVAKNMLLDQDGVWTVRPGSGAYGETLTTPIDGAGQYTKYDTDGTSDSYVWVIDNGAFKISQDGGAWTTKSGATWTTGNKVFSKQDNNRLYLANGVDALAYYDINTEALVTYTELTVPANPTAPTRTGLSAGNYNAYYVVTAVNEIGETTGSTEVSVSGGINKTRDNWTTGTDYLTFSWDTVSGATRYNIYYASASGENVWIDSTATNSYVDTGITQPNPYQEVPDENTTGGPTFGHLALSGNRLWATRNYSKPYRVYWAGTGQYRGAFNPFYGGGYIDLNLGGSERPEVVTHFRDGKGNAVATVLTSSPSGAGSTWHIALSTLTVDTLTVVVPQAYQQQGQVGTRSPRAVVDYKDSVFYPSPKGFHSIGSRQSILNVLVTTEISGNIRESVQGITNSAAGEICGYATDGRIYWSVPVGSSTNNQIWVYDLERKGVWALHWDVGVKQFFEYTDTGGKIRLLGVPVSGTKLVEFSDNIQGDSGTAFSTNLESGLIHWDKNHMGWAYINKVYLELSHPVGGVNFTVSGTQKNKAFSTLGSITITNTSSASGFSNELFSEALFSESTDAPSTFTSSSVKKYIRINKLLNNIKWQITSSNISSSYTPMQIVVKGTVIPTSDPSEYKA